MNAPAPTPILTVSHLSASIAGQQVVEDVSFEVPATGITAVLGRNGVGKTSTIRGILGLIHRQGEVTLAGERIDGAVDRRPDAPARRRPCRIPAWGEQPGGSQGRRSNLGQRTAAADRTA